MIHDKELNQILQDARGSYSDKFKDIRSSLKTISGSLNNFERDSPAFDSSSKNLSLKPSRLSKTQSSRKFKEAQSVEEGESKDLLNHIKGLEATIRSLKTQNDLVEEANFELRNRLKDAALNLKKIQHESIKPSSQVSVDSKRLRYKKKISELKMRVTEKSVEAKKIAQELDEAKKMGTRIRELCKNQVSEISEEFAFKLKQSANYFTQEYSRLEHQYLEQNKELVNENHLLEDEVAERDNRFKQELRLKEQELTAISKQFIDKEEEYHKTIKQLQNQHQAEVESLKRKSEQLQEENLIRVSQIEKLNFELEGKNKQISLLKIELETKNAENSQVPSILVDQLISNNSNLQQKLEKLEAIHKSLVRDNESSKETIKNLEVSLKIMKTSNEGQVKEILRLNKQISDSRNNYEENLKQLEKNFQSEELKKTKDFKQQFQNLNEDYQKTIEDLEVTAQRLEEFCFKTKELEQKLEDSEVIISQLKTSNFHLAMANKKNDEFKDLLKLSTKKLKTFYLIFNKVIRQQVAEIRRVFDQNASDLQSFLEFSIRNTKSQQEFQLLRLKNEFSLTLASLEKANSQILLLQQEAKVDKDKNIDLELKNQALEKMVNNIKENLECEKESAVRQIVASLGLLEEDTESNYENLISSVEDLKSVFQSEVQENNLKFFEIIRRLEESLEEHKSRIAQLEFLKSSEDKKSNSQLFEIEQQLQQTLKGIRN